MYCKMNAYLSMENYEKCLFILHQMLNDVFQYTVPEEKEEQVKKTLYFRMKDIATSGNISDLRSANQQALQICMDYLAKQYNLQKSSKPSVRNLDRDKMVYGDRRVTTAQLKPSVTSLKDGQSVDKSFEIIMAERSTSSEEKREIPNVIKGQNEEMMSLADFDKRLSMFEQERMETMKSILPKPNENIASKVDINEVYKQITGKMDMDKKEIPSTSISSLFNNAITYNQHDIIPRTQNNVQIVKYITINGFDRDWTKHKTRFTFPIDMAHLSKVYKNIASVKVTCLIIPMEIIESKTITHNPKNSYYNSFKISFPYLMLNIHEISDVYDGVNNQIRRAFANFVVDNTYKDNNGRGYAILKPIQREEKCFYPSPLAGLQKLTFSITKPNGAMFNNSRDDYNVKRVEYDTYNAMYLRVTLDKYFDKNEFYVGDTIMIRNFQIDKPASENQYTQADFNGFSEFINRNEGHEIINIGEPNENGYHMNFYIYAPGVLDQVQGKLVIDKNKVDALRSFNNANPLSVLNNAPSPLMGSVINMSLQCVISMQIALSTGDATIIKSELI